MANRVAFDPFGGATAAVDLEARGRVCISVPKRLIPYLLGAVEPLRWPDLWMGAPQDITRAMSQVENFITDLVLQASCETPCEETPCPNQPECQTCGGGGGSCFQMEVYNMPCLDLTGMIKIENGALYVKNDCCEWELIGTLESQEQAPSADDLAPLLPEGQGLSACGRAYAVWDAITKTVDAIWDHKNDAPWNIISSIRAASPTNLTTTGIIKCIIQALEIQTLELGGDVSDASMRQNALCQLSTLFEASAGPLSNQEWDAVKSVCTNFGGVVNLFVNNLYLFVAADAITRDRLSRQAQLGATNDQQDCGCIYQSALIDVTESWTGLDWSHWFDFTAEPAPAGTVLDTDEENDWKQGVGLIFKTATNGHRKGSITFDVTAFGGTWKRAYGLFKVPAGFDYAGLNFIRDHDTTLISLGQSGWYDSDPSIGGLITVNIANLTAYIDTSADYLQFQVEGYSPVHDQSEAQSIRLMALAVGGIDTDPLPGY